MIIREEAAAAEIVALVTLEGGLIHGWQEARTYGVLI